MLFINKFLISTIRETAMRTSKSIIIATLMLILSIIFAVIFKLNFAGTNIIIHPRLSDFQDGQVFNEGWVLHKRNAEDWTRRSMHGATLWKDGVMISGGYKPRHNGYDIEIGPPEVLFFKNGTMTTLTKNGKWPGRGSHRMHSYNDKVWIFGGYSWKSPSFVYGDIWNSTDGKDWQLVNPIPEWDARELQGIVTLDNNDLLLFGGVTYGPPWHAFNDVWKSQNGIDWVLVTEEAEWSGRYAFGYGTFKGNIFLMGGRNQAEEPLNDIWMSKDGTTWTKIIENAPWEERSFDQLLITNNLMFIVGGTGSKDTIYKDIWYSENGTKWCKLQDNAPYPQRFGSLNYLEENGDTIRIWKIGGVTDIPDPDNPKKNLHFLLNDIWSVDIKLSQLNTENCN